MKRWFGVGLSKEQAADLDREIKDLFESDYNAYCAGDYSGWQHDRDGRLAAVILLDQFPRSMFRSTGKAFATDDIASSIAQKALKDAVVWSDYRLFEKQFFLTSLMHIEDIAIVQLPVDEYTKMARELQENNPEAYNAGLGKTYEHNI